MKNNEDSKLLINLKRDASSLVKLGVQKHLILLNEVFLMQSKAV